MRLLDAEAAAEAVLEEVANIAGLKASASTATYQTLHTLSAGFTIGEPGLQPNAVPNSGMFTTTPLTRYFGGECGSVMARARWSSGRSLAQAHCAKPTKKRWSGVNPSDRTNFSFLSAFFQAM